MIDEDSVFSVCFRGHLFFRESGDIHNQGHSYQSGFLVGDVTGLPSWMTTFRHPGSLDAATLRQITGSGKNSRYNSLYQMD
jgi:hypothetical protein